MSIEASRKELLAALAEIGIYYHNNNPSALYTPDVRKTQALIAQQSNPCSAAEQAIAQRYFAPQAIALNWQRFQPKIQKMQAHPHGRAIWNAVISQWSVTIAKPYHHSQQYLVWDEANEKLIGIMGLCDAPFALRRNQIMGWSAEEAKEKTRQFQVAYVLGAVEPYAHFLGGKLLGLLAPTLASGYYLETYAAFGRSSIYNRLKGWRFYGYTQGFTVQHLKYPSVWRHLQPYVSHEAKGHKAELKAIKEALSILGFGEELLLPGFLRGYYITKITQDTTEALLQHWKERWLLPRIKRLTETCNIKTEGLNLPIKTDAEL